MTVRGLTAPRRTGVRCDRWLVETCRSGSTRARIVAFYRAGMTVQLRRYRIKSGRVEQFAEEWRDGVAPLRERYGFRVQGWLVKDGDKFIWLLEHQDQESFEAADAAYYASAQRQALRPDPARLIDEARTDWVSVVF
jgi:hypothetical protein